jgi:RHS repeat-associated protein
MSLQVTEKVTALPRVALEHHGENTLHTARPVFDRPGRRTHCETLVRRGREYHQRFRGQLISDAQSHSGPVTASTPRVQYGYHDGLVLPANTLRRTSMTLPSGKIAGYEFHSIASFDSRLGRLSALGYRQSGITTPELTFTYAGVAMPVHMTYPQPDLHWSLKPMPGETPNALKPYPALDRFGRLLTARWYRGATPTTPAAALVHVDYTYDRASRRTTRRLPGTTHEAEVYAYDGLSQVTSRIRGAEEFEGGTFTGIQTPSVRREDFTYDTLGNWQRYHVQAPNTATPPVLTTLLDQNRTHNIANQITSFSNSTQPLTHDAAGNTTLSAPVQEADGTTNWSAGHHYQWDAWHRLIRITRSDTGAEIARHAYDGLTRRTTLQEGGSTGPVRHFYYNDQWRSVEESLDNAALTTPDRRHLFNPLNRWHLIQRYRDTGAGETLYCLHDAMDPIAITSATGTILERYNFSAFGMRRVMQENFSDKTAGTDFAWNWEFHGEFADGASGLHNYGWRYYNATQGVWLSMDPLEENASVNFFTFAANTPPNSSDIVGLYANGDGPFQSFEEAAQKCGEKYLKEEKERAAKAKLANNQREIKYKQAMEEFQKLERAGKINIANRKVLTPRLVLENEKLRERGGRICCRSLESKCVYYCTAGEGPVPEGGMLMEIHPLDASPPCEDSDKLVGMWHTHPSSNSFSKQDLLAALKGADQHPLRGNDSFPVTVTYEKGGKVLTDLYEPPLLPPAAIPASNIYHRTDEYLKTGTLYNIFNGIKLPK